jgi:hypothetical protein
VGFERRIAGREIDTVEQSLAGSGLADSNLEHLSE